MTDAVLAASEASIAQGSKSFAAAARLFPARIREDAAMLYAWCRHCDDEIDGQVLGGGAVGIAQDAAQAKLDDLQRKTRAALAGEAMDDPAFAAFQRVAARHAIPAALPLELLEGFRMDVEGRTYPTLDGLMLYAYRVAGVVGEMMALVMGVTEPAVRARAVDLGLAFQLTNISRDVIEDARGGRIYLPDECLGPLAGDAVAVADPANRPLVFAATRSLIEAAEPYYASARWGLVALDARSAWAIAMAAGVYRMIGRKVLARGAGGMDRRAATSSADKLGEAAKAAAVALRAKTLDRATASPPRPDLWLPPNFAGAPPG